MANKILVVDDEQSIRHLCTEVLTGEGYEVVTTDEETGILGRISLEQPSAVIMDIRLENCDGLDLLQDIRHEYPALPIILYTAYDSYREDVKSVAADFYVVKSHDMSELKAKLAVVIKEGENEHNVR